MQLHGIIHVMAWEQIYPNKGKGELKHMAQITVKNLSFSYPSLPDKNVLDHISLEIEEGQYIVFCGRSGSGKSTLLRHCKTVLIPAGTTKGEILFNGVPLKQTSLRNQSSQIGYVMQNPDSQIVTDKVWHELAFGLESLGFDNQTIRRRVAEMASFFGIQNWFHKDVTELSGGEKQLLNLASIMVMQPEVLILDEPTSQLDPIAASNFLGTLRKINQELGTTILISEHRLEEVLPCADKVAVLKRGKLICYDNPREVGGFLWERKNEMFTAMPSAMQLYYETGSKGNCPLTVRDGRTWIKNYIAGKGFVKFDFVKDTQEKENKPIKTAVELKGIWFRYGRQLPDVLKGINMQVQEGTFLAILGGNGTGKTTTLKIIANLLKPSNGKVLLYGKDMGKVKNKHLFQEYITMLPQEPLSLFVKNTVKEELEEMSANKEEIAKICGLTEIEDLLEHHPYDLSGGEQQRVALAKILLTKPKILLLDEPTKGMDIFFKQKLASIIKNLQQKGMTIIMISHDIEFCASYADTIAMLFDGCIISSDTTREFFASNHFYTTAAHRICKEVCRGVITNEDAIRLCEMVKKRTKGKDE